MTIGTTATSSEYVCDDILAVNGEGDAVFALSFADVTNPNYGFDGDTTVSGTTLKAPNSATRVVQATAFAVATGTLPSTAAVWLLRSPESSYGIMNMVTGGGQVYGANLEQHPYSCAVPAMRIVLQ